MRDRGFTLIEVLTALAVLSAAVLAAGHLFVATAGAILTARLQTSTVALATARMEELRSLAWQFDSAGNSVADVSTSLASNPPGSAGLGLGLSPPGALTQNTPGYVDFLDAGGRWVSSGPTAPPGATFVRRWAIDPPADGSHDSLVLQVVVRPIVEEAGAKGSAVIGGRAEARLVTLLTRVAR